VTDGEAELAGEEIARRLDAATNSCGSAPAMMARVEIVLHDLAWSETPVLSACQLSKTMLLAPAPAIAELEALRQNSGRHPAVTGKPTICAATG